MQYLAAIAALATVAVAVPAYNAEVPAPSETSVAAYPVETSVHESSEVASYPVETPVHEETSVVVYPTESAVVPVPSESSVEMTVSTVYKTNVHTVTDCASYVTDCPADAPVHYSTETVIDYTTTCPVSKPVGTPTSVPVVITTPVAGGSSAVQTPPAVTYPVPSASSATGVPPVPGNSMTYPVGMPSVAPQPTGTGAPSASVVYPTGPIQTGAASKAGVEMGAAALLAAAALFL